MCRRTVAAFAVLLLSAAGFSVPALAQKNASGAAASRQVSESKIGPWTVTGWVSSAGAGYCTAERNSSGMQIGFSRYPQGYALLIQSPGWKLTPDGDYPVQLIAAPVLDGDSRAKVINPKTVLIPLSNDPAFLRKVASAPGFEVATAGGRIKVPLDQFSEMLVRLEACFAERGRTAANPFATATLGSDMRPTSIVSRSASLIEEQTFLTVRSGGQTYRLEAMVVKPANATGKLPVALITHGKSRALEMTALRASWMLPQARDLAYRGWLAVTVVRRGYGLSDGVPGLAASTQHITCETQDFEKAFDAEAEDLEGALRAIAARPDADGTRSIALGQSVGGGTVLALAARRPQGLVAAVNISGGMRVGNGFGQCNYEPALARAMGAYGSRTRVPTLWLYAENDTLFAPALVNEMHRAYTAASGKAELKMFGAVGEEGHALFSLAQGRALWLKELDAFLRAQNLPTWNADLAAAAVEHAQLSDVALKPAADYFAAPTPKVMVAASGAKFMHWRAAGGEIADIRKAALDACREKTGEDCTVVMENFERVGATAPQIAAAPLAMVR